MATSKHDEKEAEVPPILSPEEEATLDKVWEKAAEEERLKKAKQPDKTSEP